jgi:hypothetical protein
MSSTTAVWQIGQVAPPRGAQSFSGYFLGSVCCLRRGLQSPDFVCDTIVFEICQRASASRSRHVRDYSNTSLLSHHLPTFSWV